MIIILEAGEKLPTQLLTMADIIIWDGLVIRSREQNFSLPNRAVEDIISDPS